MRKRKSEVAAIEAIKRRISQASSKGQMQEVADLYNQLGNQHRLLGNYEDALDAHQEEVNFSKRYNKKDKMALGIAYRNIAEVLYEMEKLSEAVRYIRMYLKIAQDTENLVEEQRANITLGRAYLRMGELWDTNEENRANSENQLNSTDALEKAVQSFRQAYKLLGEDELIQQIKEEKERMLMKCNNCQNLGVALESQGKYNDAISWLAKGITIGNKYGFHENLAPCYSVLSGIYLKEKKWKDAVDAAKKATNAAKATGNQELEIENILLEAKALFMNDEVDFGKKILKRLRQKLIKKQELHAYLEELDNLLVAAVRISRTQDRLFVASKDDAEMKMKLHEILGDNYCTLKVYQIAVVHYRKACEYAESLGVTGKKLARLYFSIAATYQDLENYNNACKYYTKEMQLNSGNPAEEFKTQTNIAYVFEKLNKNPEEIIKAHNLAVEFARLSKDAKKEITALKSLSVYLKTIGRREEAEKYNEKVRNLKSAHNISDEDEADTEGDSQDLLGDNDVDLDNLSDEEDSDEEENDGKKPVKKRINIRLNEAGESQLHIAAKKGDLNAVRRLIRQGHPVSVKDNAGWTPLHEACNFGHVEVVEELLKHRADVNDAGGALVDKITPLHDAASNCHCEVMKVLIKYGANVLARDAEGRYPIDSLLAWRESDIGKDCSEDELVSYREVKEWLKDCMAKAGKPYREEDEKRTRKKMRTTRQRSPDQSVLLVTKPYERDCPILATTVLDDYDPDKEGSGAEFYKKAMKQVGRKSLEEGGSKKEKGRPISPGPRGALIPSEKDFHQRHEDWLLPDDTIVPSTSKTHQTAKPKRKRDPTEDVLLDERSTRRKTGSCGRKPRYCEEEEDIIHDFMEIESPTNQTASNISQTNRNSQKSASDELEVGILSDDDEDFSKLFSEDITLEEDVSVPKHDDFLPSQLPNTNATEFGRTSEVPIVEDEDDDIVPGRRNNRSPTKRYGTITVSSDEDDCQTTGSKIQLKYSQLSTVLKQANKRTGKTLVQSRLLPVKVVKRNPPPSDSDDSTASITVSTGFSSNIDARKKNLSSVTQCGTDGGSSGKRKDVLRLKIRILGALAHSGTLLLVPVDDKNMNQTIDWLAQECASRYFRLHGVKPVLSLQTKDGASLSGSDPISLVLEANERELDGVVVNFDMPPLVERYCAACSDAAIEPDPEITSSLNNCQSSNILNLTDVYLRKTGNVLMTALQRQTALRVLVLSGCSIFDTGIVELCKALPTLSGLTELDISSNGITKDGLTSLSETFLRDQTSETASNTCTLPVGLTSLILSHNPLGNQIGVALASLITKLSSLRRLEISDCNLSEKLFLWGNNELLKTFLNSKLEELDISFNAFKDIGLEKLLMSLPARRIRSLNCSSCFSHSITSTSDGLAKAVCALLSGNEDCCSLRTLQLNDCGLNDNSMNRILDNFDRVVRLDCLDLACNDRLTSLSLVNILNRSVELEIPLTNLNMGSIPKFWNSRVNNEQIQLAVENKLASRFKISSLRLPVSDLDDNGSSNEHGSQPALSDLEGKIASIMSEYAGLSTFNYEKQSSCIMYTLAD